MAVTINGDTGIDKVVDDTITTDDIQDGAITAAKIASGAIPNSYAGTKNLIINGDMRIDQRNSGASLTVNTAAVVYSVDRLFTYGQASDGVFTVQQVTDAPSGFINSVKATVTTADASIGASQLYILFQRIEGNNIAHLDWGTANAKTVTLSFWVKSSLTGTFSGSLKNHDASRAYPFTYTISSANTWEKKTITITGETTGTWLTTNAVGITLTFTLGSGSSRLGTANTWNAAYLDGATGTTEVIATNGATLYITGLQLEVGTEATPFEHRPYDMELARCQRYFEIMGSPGSTSNSYAVCAVLNSTTTRGILWFKTEKRATPTITVAGTWYALPQGITASASFFPANTYNAGIGQTWSGLTVGQASYLYDGGSGTSRVLISAEL